MKKRLTKTGLIFTLAIIYANLISAQDYMITFTGSGQSNLVDIIEIKNIQQQTTVTMNGTDTLRLVGVVGISPVVQEYAGMKVYPNPTKHTSRVEFHNLEAGSVTLEIIEMTGKTLSNSSINLSRGLHTFEIQGLGTGIYLLKVTTETKVHQQQLITYSHRIGNPQINYIGSFDQALVPVEMKSTKNIVVMQYNAGERLVLKGISGDYSHTISLIPSESQNVDFDFIDCIDGDGNHYNVVTIGVQVWMAEHLKSTKDAAGNGITRYCYANNTTNCDLYGGLYTWATIMNGAGSSNSNPSGVQGVCPTGWHVPSDAEWTELVNYVVSQGYPNSNVVGGASNALKSCHHVGSPLGGACNTSDHPRWSSDSMHYGTDAFGFSALPGGLRYTNGVFGLIGLYSPCWSSTEFSSASAWIRRLGYARGGVHRDNYDKAFGYSLRCVRD